MKTQEEIKDLADKWLLATGIKEWWIAENGYIKGYTQCQEDLKPLIDDLWLLWLDIAEACGIQRDTHKIGLYKGRYVNFSTKFNELEKQINHGKDNT